MNAKKQTKTNSTKPTKVTEKGRQTVKHLTEEEGAAKRAALQAQRAAATAELAADDEAEEREFGIDLQKGEDALEAEMIADDNTAWVEEQRRTSLIKAVREHASKHYNEGGWDFVVEAYEDRDIAKAIEGAMTAKQAIAMVAEVVGIRAEQRRDSWVQGGLDPKTGELPREEMTISAADVGQVPAELIQGQPLPFRPLSLDAQRAIRAAKEQRKPGVRRGPTKGQTLALAHDVEVIEVTTVEHPDADGAAEHNVAGAPSLTVRRVGKRKLSQAERAAVVKAGTKVEFVERRHIRTRQGDLKDPETGARVRQDVEVRADVVRLTVPATPDSPDGQELLIAIDRGMWLKTGELTKDAMVAVEAEVKE